LTPILETKNVSFTYGSGTPFEHRALTDISFSLNEGEIIGLIGHTGSGKSTLIQHLNGLLKPQSGEVCFNGQNITDKGFDLRGLRFKVGLVFQYPEYQLFEETVEKDIAFGPRNQQLPPDEIQLRVRRALADVGLPESVLNESPFALSGGQKRRAAIAGVLAMRPQVLILDEPTAGLDPGGRRSILRHIAEYHRSTGASVVLVTHNMEEVAGLVDRIAVMKNGAVVLDGSPLEVFGHAEKLQADGLSVPQITQVFSLLSKKNPAISPSVCTLEQAVEVLTAAWAKRKDKPC
jgi:energy-coupling factor transport system ATP-binding protein